MEQDVVTIKEVPSGTIDVVHVKQGQLLQFNCSCADALPYCKGMCCGMRHMYNTHLTDEEAASGKYAVLNLSTRPGENFIAFDPDTKHCIHQTSAGFCGVHLDKPESCGNWHCSPGGVGEGVTRRSGGWFMLPIVMDNDSLRTIGTSPI